MLFRSDPAHADNINVAPKQLLQNTVVNKKAISRLENPEFEDYTGETELPDPDAAVGMIASGEPVGIIQQYTKASLRGILTIAKKALNIALGRNQARVFTSVADLDAWLAVPENTEQLNVGDNFYIIATDVPDYWWDGTQKQKLETQKVDLSTYDQRITANANAISQLNGDMSGKQNNIGFTPIQQGTGIGQLNNTIKIGWSDGYKLKATVDNTDLGNFVFENSIVSAKKNVSTTSLATNGYSLYFKMGELCICYFGFNFTSSGVNEALTGLPEPKFDDIENFGFAIDKDNGKAYQVYVYNKGLRIRSSESLTNRPLRGCIVYFAKD